MAHWGAVAPKTKKKLYKMNFYDCFPICVCKRHDSSLKVKLI